MLRITVSKHAAAAAKYFEEGLSKQDYYSEKGEVIGKWQGELSKQLGLSGEVTKSDFEKLASNINPETGEQLTVRNSPKRRAGYDATFSAPKSVSLVYAMTEDKDILKAFQSAISDTMKELEKDMQTQAGQGKNKHYEKTGNIAWAGFTHFRSRPVEVETEAGKFPVPDPHLHQHCFIFNATWNEKKQRHQAIEMGTVKGNAPYYEAVFNSRLANNLQELGYQIERDERSFQLKDFGRNIIDKFSNRTAEIEKRAKELGITYTEDKSQLGAKTRGQKRKDLGNDELLETWAERLTPQEAELIGNAKKDPFDDSGNTSGNKPKEMNAEKALDYSLSHNLERKSTVSEKEIFISALKRSYGSVTPDELRQKLDERKNLLSKLDKWGNTIYTTQEALQEEQHLKKAAREGQGLMKPLNEGFTPKNEKLSPEQANAVQHVLSSKDFITIVAGGAGTGKTWSIKEVAEGVKQKEISFGAFAPSAAASRGVQREDGFHDATTIADLLQNEKLQKSLKNGVIWIDEAGMVGNKTMNQIIEVAKEQKARILLTGDIKQHNSVERGDALRIIQEYGGVKAARISKIQRQQVNDYKQVVKLISNGNMSDGVKALDSMNAIKEAETYSDLKENVANEYAQAVKAKEDTLIVATTHAQGKGVTSIIREKLKESKLISGKEKGFTTYRNLSFTEAEKKDLANYQEGMTIQFHQNSKGGIKRGAKYDVVGKDKNGNLEIREANNAIEKKSRFFTPNEAKANFSVYEKEKINLAKGDKIRITQNGFSMSKKRVNNGNILSVKGFDEAGNIVTTSGKRDMVLHRDFGNLTHGYYTTSPASQGKSVNRVIVMQGSMAGKAASKEQFYVSASRGKFAISIHTDDKAQLFHSVNRSTQRMTASEVAEKSHSKSITALKNTFQKFGLIQQAVKSRVENLKDYWQKGVAYSAKPMSQKPITHAAPTKG